MTYCLKMEISRKTALAAFHDNEQEFRFHHGQHADVNELASNGRYWGGCDGRTIFSGINNTGLKEKELSF